MRLGCGSIIAIGFVTVAVITVVSAVIDPPPDRDYSKEATKVASSEAPEDDKTTRSQAVVQLLKKSLRNPDSFEAESVLVTDAGAVCVVYRAQNGFGGISLERAVVSADLKKAAGSNEKGFSSLWNRECANKTGLETKYLYRHR